MVNISRAPLTLKSLVEKELKTQGPKGLEVVVRAIQKKHREAILAMVFYGSCLRSNDLHDGILDLYVLVDSYIAFYKRPLMALWNFLLPPNVFYLETGSGEDKLRIKYAVISLPQLERATTTLWFHSYFWARLCQPVRLIFFKDQQVFERVKKCVLSALFTFFVRTLPCIEKDFSEEMLWCKGLALTYRAELRPEGQERARTIWQSNKKYLKQITPYVLSWLNGGNSHIISKKAGSYRLDASFSQLFACKMPWIARIALGKLLSVFRLVKAAFTFRGGVDYALWKIKRHTGIELELSPFLKRHPVLAMVFASWRLFLYRAIR